MSKGIFVAASGSVAQLHRLEVMSHNLAHARTTGFKRDDITTREIGVAPELARESDDKRFAQTHGAHARLDEGVTTRTDNPLDIALRGRSFLRVQTAQGERLTRDGRLMRGVDGLLRTQRGHLVLDAQGGGIALPEGRAPEIAEDGAISAGQTLLARLGTRVLREGTALRKDVQGLFVPPTAADDPQAQPSILQGHLEGSNVEPVTQLTQLIAVQRHFEALQQAISTHREMDATAIRLPR